MTTTTNEGSRKVVVSAATYNRPTGLTTLLDGIESLSLESDVALRVVITDNSEEGNARDYVEQRIASYRFPLKYHHETERGISQARNRGLRDALQGGDDFLAFIDDDETPESGWITNLLAVCSETGSVAVVGAVRPVFEVAPSWWIQSLGIFDSSGFRDREPAPHGSTANAMVDLAFIRKHGIEFDMRYGLSGGEDTDFFRQIASNGGKIVFAQQAVTVETIVAGRATFGWLTQFWFRSGNTDGIVTQNASKGSARVRLKLFLGGLARVLVGGLGALITLPLLAVKSVLPIQLWRVLCRGVGYLASSTGVVYEEYKNHAR